MKVLVIGCGSIGRRHLKNLISLGIRDLLVFDIDERRLAEIRRDHPHVMTASRLGALFKEKPDAAIIAVPTALHILYATQAAKAGCHLFIEKPLSHDADGLTGLKHLARNKQLVTFLGYNFRFHPCLLELKKILAQKLIGKVVSGRTHFGSYLPDRHPGEDYRRGYGAKRSMGGGVILDTLSHHVDYLSFLLGRPKAVFCYAAKHSKLAIDVEDVAEILIKFTNGAVISIHGDCIQRPYKHTLEFIGETGTARSDLFAQSLEYFNSRSKRWTKYHSKGPLDKMYADEMRCFLSCVKRGVKSPVDLNAGVWSLNVLMKIKQSAAKKCWVAL